MYDLHVPVERYEAEKYKMADLLNNLDENKELVMLRDNHWGYLKRQNNK